MRDSEGIPQKDREIPIDVDPDRCYCRFCRKETPWMKIQEISRALDRPGMRA